MADFTVRSDSVDVDEIMKQIRTRIREKRGVDYTEADLQHLANIKMEQFLDPRKLRSDLVEQFKRQRAASPAPHTQEGAAPPVETGNVFKRMARRLVRRIVRSAVNPQDTVDALNAEFRRREELYYEILHNLVLELTRLGIEVHNLRMQAESLSGRLDFDERRGRALESVVQYKPAPERPAPSGMPGGAAPLPQGPTITATGNAGTTGAPGNATAPWTPHAGGGPGGQGRPDGERRRRRRRRRRRPGDRPGTPGAPGTPGTPGTAGAGGAQGAPAPMDAADDAGGNYDDGGDAGEGDGASDQ